MSWRPLRVIRGDALSPGSKGSERGSGFYELRVRFIPGPWSGGEAQA